MKAVSYVINNYDDFKNSLVDIEKAKPTLKERDVLVKVQAISVNPVDTKVRKNSSEANNRILGWDAVGEIIEVGSKVTSFKVGDSVWYAGDLPAGIFHPTAGYQSRSAPGVRQEVTGGCRRLDGVCQRVYGRVV